MAWVTIAVLCAPLWLVIGGGAAALVQRRRVRRTPGTFACKVGFDRGNGSHARPAFPRTRSFAKWSHNVLVVYRGPALRRAEPLGAVAALGPLYVPEGGVPGLGAA